MKSKRRSIRKIRLFTVKQHVAYSPRRSRKVHGNLFRRKPSPETGGNGFSAVAYFFGRKLQAELHVPIGLIEDCWGGTPAESWMSPESLHKLKDFDAPLAEIERLWHAKGGPGIRQLPP